MNAHSAAAKSLRDAAAFQADYDRTAQDLRTLNQAYSAEKGKLASEQERVRKLEVEIEGLRAENAGLLVKVGDAESSQQDSQLQLEKTKKRLDRKDRAMRAIGRQFKRTMEDVKEKLLGSRSQAVRDFLASGSYKSCLLAAKGTEFSSGFDLAIDQLVHNKLLPENYNAELITDEKNVDGSERPPIAPEDDMDMDLVKQEEFWPLVRLMVESQPEVAPDVAPDDRAVANAEPSANTPPPVPVLVERYPAWFPKVLESINISCGL